MANASHHNITRGFQLLQGSAWLPSYNGGKDGIEWTPQYNWKPTSIQPLVFAAALAAGATAPALNASWGPPSGLYTVTLSTGQQIQALLTQGATTCTFWNVPNNSGVMTAAQVNTAATATASVAGVPPLLAVVGNYAASQSIAAGGSAVLNGASTGAITVNGVTYALAGLPDVPRNVVGTWTGASNVTVTGLDTYGQLTTEVLSTPAGSTGRKAFAVVISITSSAAITVGVFGFGSVLGLPFKVASGGWMGAFLNDAVDAGTFTQGDPTYPPTGTTGDPRGTYAPSGALNGAKMLLAEIKAQDTTTQIGSFGYSPA
jgi:hypothetical protein